MTERINYNYRGDPRAAVLTLDSFQFERESAEEEARSTYKRDLDLIERFFGNISGLYRGSRPGLTAEEIKQRDRRRTLWREAEKTGDDTKLREFKAKIEAERRTQLRHRINRIDEWIAANRERLEAEAAAYTPAAIPQRGLSAAVFRAIMVASLAVAAGAFAAG